LIRRLLLHLFVRPEQLHFLGLTSSKRTRNLLNRLANSAVLIYERLLKRSHPCCHISVELELPQPKLAIHIKLSPTKITLALAKVVANSDVLEPKLALDTLLAQAKLALNIDIASTERQLPLSKLTPNIDITVAKRQLAKTKLALDTLLAQAKLALDVVSTKTNIAIGVALVKTNVSIGAALAKAYIAVGLRLKVSGAQLTLTIAVHGLLLATTNVRIRHRVEVVAVGSLFASRQGILSEPVRHQGIKR
jgi:hypothetical protein